MSTRCTLFRPAMHRFRTNHVGRPCTISFNKSRFRFCKIVWMTQKNSRRRPDVMAFLTPILGASAKGAVAVQRPYSRSALGGVVNP